MWTGNPLPSGHPRVVEKSVNSVSAFGAKSSVHFLLPEGNPLGGLLLSPPNQVAQPSAALLRYGCGIPLAGTCAGLRRGPRWATKSAPTKVPPERGNVSFADKGVPRRGFHCGGVPLQLPGRTPPAKSVILPPPLAGEAEGKNKEDRIKKK